MFHQVNITLCIFFYPVQLSSRPLAAMHHALLIQELIEIVFQHVEDGRALSRLARTFTRVMTPRDWEILYSYTRRVKKVVVYAWDTDESTTILHSRVYRALSDCPLSNLFPKLHTIRVEGDTTGYNRHYRYLMTQGLLLSPNLRAIHVDIMMLNRFLSDVPLITELCPNVESFSCRNYDNQQRPPRNGEPDLLTRTLCQWECIRSVDCGTVSAEILSHMVKSPSPSLDHLSVPVNTEEPWLAGHYGIHEIKQLSLIVDGIDTFPRALRALLLNGNSTTQSSSLSESQAAHLHTLDVLFDQHMRPCAIEPPPRPPFLIFKSLAECVSHACLTSIKLSESKSSVIKLPINSRFDKDALSPLCAFSMLTELIIDLNRHPIVLEDFDGNGESDARDGGSDEALAALVSYWPRLEQLKLKKLQRPASLAGLFAVLTSCPRLTYLNMRICVDPRQVNIAAESMSGANSAGPTKGSAFTPLPRNPCITWLDLTHTSERLQDIKPLARVLYHVVPSLCSCGRSDSFVSLDPKFKDSNISGRRISMAASVAGWLPAWSQADFRGNTSAKWNKKILDRRT
ncbi:hypothetical protein CONPUDRAFT_77242 [Coniophora puteana RWD-64-598 SS2]|uniref:F-box domain-containing protein n=1 Tax=Coniophora puteana (strain RWD-64-598) TaxID=741705 RepID=A0A5M3M931_CONPW|nr:uncharacterized protein CONPUDRAFT_77242 [Coniophora puteana RWD-64-598 SS2]EIW75587.1 hypothetical protein CONPUDRAFT_77242 [Coniophora puteana RWD-64-598 SS2]